VAVSDILDRRIADELRGPRIDLVSGMTVDELRAGLDFQLSQLSRLTAALAVLYPHDRRPGEGSIDRAIRILENVRDAEAMRERMEAGHG